MSSIPASSQAGTSSTNHNERHPTRYDEGDVYDGDDLNNSAYFRRLDQDFLHLKKAANDEFVYSAIDVLVQNTWELPIIIQWPRATVRFKFSTGNGDIYFGVAFVPAPEENEPIPTSQDDYNITIIQEIDRVQSDDGEIEGEFELPCEGVVIFLWDNNFDWMANKQLSYTITVYEPSFTTLDDARCATAEYDLDKVLPILNDAYLRNADAEDYIANEKKSINEKLSVIEAIRQELNAKCKELETAEIEATALCNRLANDRSRISGLCIRSLSKALLSEVLSYLNPDGAINVVCRYWATIACALRDDTVPISIFDQLTCNKHIPVIEGVTPEQPKTMAALEKRGIVAQLKHHQRVGSTVPTESNAVEDKRWLAEYLGGKLPKPSSGSAANGILAKRVTAVQRLIETLMPTNSGALAGTIDQEGCVDVPFTSNYTNENSVNTSHYANANQNNNNENKGKKQHNVSFADERANNNLLEGHNDTAMHTVVHKGPQSQPSQESVPRATQRPSISPTEPHDSHRNNDKETGKDQDEGVVQITKAVKIQEMLSPKDGKPKSVGTKPPPNVNAKPSTTAIPPSSSVADVTEKQLPTSSNVSKGASLSHPQQYNQQLNASIQARIHAHEERVMANMKSIQSEQQLLRLIEHVNEALDKLGKLEKDKRRAKVAIKAWDASFQKENNRVATNRERKALAGGLYEHYNKISLMLRVKGDKLDDFLGSLGLDRKKFDDLKAKQTNYWKGLVSKPSMAPVLASSMTSMKGGKDSLIINTAASKSFRPTK